MVRRAFIFSLDAFVAFVLIAVVISLIIFAAGVPKASYLSLEQAHQLAHDTLQALATGSDAPGNPTYLEQILGPSGTGSTKDIMFKVAGGNPDYHGIIPKGYGYKLQKYIFNANAGGDQWQTLFDVADYSDSDRFQKNYTKLQASATTVLSLYTITPLPGKSPFCHFKCQGYEINGTGFPIPVSTCNVTPCDEPKPVFNEGENAIQLVRLVVYT